MVNRRDAETQRKTTERGSVSRSALVYAELLRVTDPRSNADFLSTHLSAPLRLCGEKVWESWLPDMDLNHDKVIQSHLCYRYTIGQCARRGKVESFTPESRS